MDALRTLKKTVSETLNNLTSPLEDLEKKIWVSTSLAHLINVTYGNNFEGCNDLVALVKESANIFFECTKLETAFQNLSPLSPDAANQIQANFLALSPKLPETTQRTLGERVRQLQLVLEFDAFYSAVQNGLYEPGQYTRALQFQTTFKTLVLTSEILKASRAKDFAAFTTAFAMDHVEQSMSNFVARLFTLSETDTTGEIIDEDLEKLAKQFASLGNTPERWMIGELLQSSGFQTVWREDGQPLIF